VSPVRCPLIRRHLRLARYEGGRCALLGAEGQVLHTRATFARAVLTLADELAPLVGDTSTVLLSLPNGAPFLMAMAALRARGARVALVDASAPRAELEAGALAIGASGVLASSDRLTHCDRDWCTYGMAYQAIPDLPPVVAPAGAALFKMTSGSTGTPRAFAMGVRQIVADAIQIMATMRIQASHPTLAAAPLSHSYGIGNCVGPFFMFGLPLAFARSLLPAALAETLVAARIAHFPAVPAMVRALAQMPGLPALPDLSLILSAGAPLLPADGRDFFESTGIPVHVLYGSSECGGITFDRETVPGHPAGQVGSAVERVDVQVVDGDGNVLPAGQEGRVRVSSLGTALGVMPPLDNPADLQHPTFLAGDLGIIDERGVLTLTSRLTELINVGGKKVSPEEVRRVIEALPGVRGAVVVGLADPRRDQRVAAVVAVEPSAGLTVDAVLQACRERLARHKVPRRVLLVDELPVSERGKVRRDAVLAMLARARV
jgi:long-chain acyl-CoA synthetase